MVKYKLDSSKNGCTGMFYRTSPDMNATDRDPSWPRNGEILDCELLPEHPGWVKCSNGKYLPLEQYGNPVLHKL